MKSMVVIALIVAALGLTACSTTYRTQSNYQAGHDFSAYKTYAWASEATADSGYGRYGWANERIQYHIERALAAKGYRRVSSPQEADFTVRLSTDIRTVKQRRYEYDSPDFYVHDYRRGYRGYYPYYEYPYYPYFDIYFGYPYYYDRFGYYSPYHRLYPRRQIVRTYTYQERTISVDIIDSNIGKPVWYGSSVERLGADYSEAPDAPLSKVMSELLKDFPPER